MDRLGTTVPLAYGDTSGRIIAVFFDVFRELGHGFSEAVYCRSICVALRQAQLQVLSEVNFQVRFRGVLVGNFYADLIVESVILVEVKAARSIERYAEAQLLNYLKAAGGGVGLLLNFGRKPEFKRLVMGSPRPFVIPA